MQASREDRVSGDAERGRHSTQITASFRGCVRRGSANRLR